MTEKQRAEQITLALKEAYPGAVCSLNYQTPYELLIATRLSAQCTDARVNQITPALFRAFPDPQALGAASPEEIEPYIRSCGLYHSKAKDLAGIGKMLTERYGGQVPDTLEELVRLPGVGRKTANLVCGDIFGKPAVVTDTHFLRICNRLGLIDTKDPLKAEIAMRGLLDPAESNDFCHRTVLHGRAVCTARSPKCDRCCLLKFCPRKGV